MSAAVRMLVALVATVASAGVLATVRVGWVDVVDGTVLVVSLAALARTAIRLASEPPDTRLDGP